MQLLLWSQDVAETAILQQKKAVFIPFLCKSNDSSHQKTKRAATSAPGKGASNGGSRPPCRAAALMCLLRQHIWKLESIQRRYDTQIREALPAWQKPVRKVHLHHCWDRQWPVGQRRMWNWEPHSLGLGWWRVDCSKTIWKIPQFLEVLCNDPPLPRNCMWPKVTQEFLVRLFHNASTIGSPTLWLNVVLFESPVARKSATWGVRNQQTVTCWIFNKFSSLLVCLKMPYTCWDTGYALIKKWVYQILYNNRNTTSVVWYLRGNCLA